MNEILRIPEDLQNDFIQFAYAKVHNNNNDIKTQKIDNSVKGRLKRSEKEWADAFTELFYGVPVEKLLEKNTDSVTESVTAKITAAQKEATQKKMNGIVLHLYHTIGLSVNQIAETVDLNNSVIEAIISQANIDEQPTRSCVLPVSAIESANITTIEGLSETGNHPLQLAWDEVDVPQA